CVKRVRISNTARPVRVSNTSAACTSVSSPARVLRAGPTSKWVKQLFAALMTAAVLLALSVSGRAWAVEPFPQVPDPPKAVVQSVASSMKVDGVPTRILQFQSRLAPKDITEFYRGQWSRGFEHAPVVRPLGDASVISQLSGAYLMTVKV